MARNWDFCPMSTRLIRRKEKCMACKNNLYDDTKKNALFSKSLFWSV